MDKTPMRLLCVLGLVSILLCGLTVLLLGNNEHEENVQVQDGMVQIPGGTFLMGSAETDADAYENEFPIHEVTITGFWMDESEVTTEAFEKYIEDHSPDPTWYARHIDNSYDWKYLCNIGTDRKDHPVNCVTWYAAQDYCTKQSKRLPTEAEWEYASGNGAAHTRWSIGNSYNQDQYCVHRSSIEATCPVKNFAPNSFGLYDMGGNVMEWCQDWYDSSFYSRTIDWTDPVNTTETEFRVIRGGSWQFHSPRNFRVTHRYWYAPHYWTIKYGFRCARDEE